MGISVISSAAASATAIAAQPGATAPDSLPGDFAALLSGELNSALGLILGNSTKRLTTDCRDQAAKQAASDSTDTTATGIDPSLMAALAGNIQFQPQISLPRLVSFQPPGEGAGKGISGIASGITDSKAVLGQTEMGSAKPVSVSDSAQIEKFSLASPASLTTPGSMRNEAANIAVDAAVTEPLPSALITPNAAAAGQSSPAAAIAQQANVTPHLQDPAWPQQFSEKIVWLAKNDQQTAQININPPQLGPVQITINLNGDQASVAFASPHAEVRQAIENALPQLKEMLNTAGISLGQANVGSHNAHQNSGNAFQSSNGNRSANETAILPANDAVSNTVASQALHRGRGLVDLFA